MSDRLAVGIVCYSSLGGSGVVAADLAAGMAARGHRVHIIASAPPMRGLPISDHLQVHTVRVPDYPLFDHPPYEMALAATIVAVAEAQRLDLVHAHYAVPHAASLHLARQVLGRAAPRAIATLHGTDVTRVGLDPSQRAVTRFAVAAADHITVPSEFLRREAHRRLGLPEAPAIEVIPNFVDTEHFAPPAQRDRRALAALFTGRDEGGPFLFHVSNFRPVKRTADLAAVLALVRRRMPARLVAVGEGPELDAARAAAARLGLADAMCFLGRQADFTPLLRQA
ncbi:MAG: N-acetyl-alpha-D-glucosaminyl L-malate synthase BshA, partial [Candidatus Binatia bacterium]